MTDQTTTRESESSKSTTSAEGALSDSSRQPEAEIGNQLEGKPIGLWGEAWRDLRRRPLFIVAGIIILFLLLVAAFPWLFTDADPLKQFPMRAREGPSAEAWFGYDKYGRDIYARVIYGAQASIVVGILSTLLTVAIGAIVGVFSGYFGGKLDSLLSRFGEVFLGLPFILGAIVILSVFNASEKWGIIGLVVAAIGLLAWPISMRIMRSAALAARQQDYVKAAKAMGASHGRIAFKHVLPNAVAPVLVYATIILGAFIGLEATLSYLGLGLSYPVISWGKMISGSQYYIATAPHMLLFPMAALVITVLAFVMLGDAVRDALDPKQK